LDILGLAQLSSARPSPPRFGTDPWPPANGHNMCRARTLTTPVDHARCRRIETARQPRAISHAALSPTGIPAEGENHVHLLVMLPSRPHAHPAAQHSATTCSGHCLIRPASPLSGVSSKGRRSPRGVLEAPRCHCLLPRP
jgi:hypothetical protein